MKGRSNSSVNLEVTSGANVADTDALVRVKSPDRKRARKVVPQSSAENLTTVIAPQAQNSAEPPLNDEKSIVSDHNLG